MEMVGVPGQYPREASTLRQMSFKMVARPAGCRGLYSLVGGYLPPPFHYAASVGAKEKIGDRCTKFSGTRQAEPEPWKPPAHRHCAFMLRERMEVRGQGSVRGQLG